MKASRPRSEEPVASQHQLKAAASRHGKGATALPSTIGNAGVTALLRSSGPPRAGGIRGPDLDGSVARAIQDRHQMNPHQLSVSQIDELRAPGFGHIAEPVARMIDPGPALTDSEESLGKVMQDSRKGGTRLQGDVRTSMEGAFGEDFSAVRVHTGPDADYLNGRLQARALTIGNDILFSQGSYNPRSAQGKRLLAHELTHVVQQKGAEDRTQLRVTDPGDSCEREARRVAAYVTSAPDAQNSSFETPQRPHVSSLAAFEIQRNGDNQATGTRTEWFEERTSTRSVMVFTEYTAHIRLRFNNDCDNMGIEVENHWLTGVTSAFPNTADINVYFGSGPAGLSPGREVEEDESGVRTITLRRYLHVDHFIKVGVDIEGFGYAARVPNGYAIFPVWVTATCGVGGG